MTAKTPNFAGNYTFVEWGCGTECQSSMIIDWRNGKINDALTACLGYSYSSKSKAIIVNPEPNLLCPKEIFIWNDNKKKFTKIKITP